METLKLKYESAKSAITSLKEIIKLTDQKKQILTLEFIDPEVERKILRDSTIQRFEYSVDTLWKYLKEYLLQIKGITQNSPKPVFRSCLQANLVSAQETEKLMEMVDDRNLTTHTYKEDLANTISEHIPTYLNLMEKLLQESKKDF